MRPFFRKKDVRTLIPALLAALTLAVPQTVSVFGQSYYEQLNELTQSGFEQNQKITRGEFCRVIGRMFYGEPQGSSVSGFPFEDRAEIKPEDVAYVAELYDKGVLAGIPMDGKIYMLPDKEITREEAFAMLGRALSASSEMRLDFSDASDIKEYAYKQAAWFVEQRISQGYPDGTFRPNVTITASELASLAVGTHNFTLRNEASIGTFAGTGSTGLLDGTAQTARFRSPGGVVYDSEDESFIVLDTYNNSLREISSGNVKTIAGKADKSDDYGFPAVGYEDGKTEAALLGRPSYGAINSKGELVFCDTSNNAIRYISGGEIRTLAGGKPGHLDGASDTARFSRPMALAIDKDDNIYVADSLNSCIRLIDPEGNVTTIAGVPVKDGYADGKAEEALFRAPCGLALSGDTLYISDTGNHRIRKLENGVVETVAGTVNEYDEDGYPIGGFEDGSPETAMFRQPAGIALAEGVIIVADSGNNAVRAITPNGVSTAAGNGEPGDKDGPALGAALSRPMGVYYRNGAVYIADAGNNKIKLLRFDASIY